MPWIIGIDEAGYGPNLGPLVMTAVACRLPDDAGAGDLWQHLASAVRRRGDPDDGRLLIEDSKIVYAPNRGLGPLETGVLATLVPQSCNGACLRLDDYLDQVCPTSRQELLREAWYTGATTLPVLAEQPQLAAARERFCQTCQETGVTWAPLQTIVVGADHFNALCERSGTKGAVLGHCLSLLVRQLWHLTAEGDSLAFLIDKHGGRNTYAALLQDAVPEGMVLAHQEGAVRSVYAVHGVAPEVRFTFQPRADAEHFGVALASMVSKYLREVLMLEFNRFWQTQVPGLKPTAGYPSDAGRFFKAIRPALQRLGITETAVWRKR